MAEHRPNWPKEYWTKGQDLIANGNIASIEFSEGTYQVEVRDRKSDWPFLQLDDFSRVLDCFCSCKEAGKKGSCVHLATAYLAIVSKEGEPLHLRFRHSFWNALFLLCLDEFGDNLSLLKGSVKQGYLAKADHDRNFSLQALNSEGFNFLEKLICQRQEETEATSLKFSNLSEEELKRWREKRPSRYLRYELSFWSDLAKSCLLNQDQKKAYKITFDEEKGQLPHAIHASFPHFEFQLSMRPGDWDQLVQSLNSIESPLHLFERQKEIKAIEYDEDKQEFRLIFDPTAPMQKKQVKKEEGIRLNHWMYYPKTGFFPIDHADLLSEETIGVDKIAEALTLYTPLFERSLKSHQIFEVPHKLQYKIFFSTENALHIQSYLYQEGDLSKPKAVLFGNWLYLPEKGFYRLAEPYLSEIELIVPKEDIATFVDRYRHWLNLFDGFHIHLYGLQSDLKYTLNEEKQQLEFILHGEQEEDSGEVIEFDHWTYVKDQGFYPKMLGKDKRFILTQMQVSFDKLETFISAHSDELEGIPSFFATDCPVQKIELSVTVDPEERIVTTPTLIYAKEYRNRTPRHFGAFFYVPGEGFSSLPPGISLPAPYTEKQVIPKNREAHFLSQDLPRLKALITHLDQRLIIPKELVLRIDNLRYDKRGRGRKWLLDLSYVSEFGHCPIYEVWQKLVSNGSYFFSSAGLFPLKNNRFDWLKAIKPKRWLNKGQTLRLSTLEWIKLSAFEEMRRPTGQTLRARKTRELIEQFYSLQVESPLDTTGLRSTLRSYQELGLKWLWFLYNQDLSGLLCDEMGLGKTHQAMALLAAAYNAHMQGNRPFKALVVCPTSVIYHWEDLLKRFFPKLSVKVFYGASRTLEDFVAHRDLLLTSYGILRSENAKLSKLSFDIAIFDEIQAAKNAKSQTHKALCRIKAAMRLGLTGTPIENNLLELKALFDGVLPDYIPNHGHFKPLFINPIEKQDDNQAKDLLKRLISPFILRRKKSEVLLELPEKIEEIAYCPLSDQQKKLYKDEVQKCKTQLIDQLADEEKRVPYVHVFALLTKLKQICDHPCLINKDFINYKSYASGKWDLFTELVEEAHASNLKIVVFSQYLEMLDLIQRYLTEQNIGFAGIRGATRNRRAELERFRDDPNCRVFVASLQAAGVGIDLTSASVVIHYDRWWNPAKENQATDRVHRIGQSRGVQVFKMVTRGTIEEHIFQMIERKKGLLDEVIGYDDQDQVKTLSKTELIEILQLSELTIT